VSFKHEEVNSQQLKVESKKQKSGSKAQMQRFTELKVLAAQSFSGA
jgi:hypothetical protein